MEVQWQLLVNKILKNKTLSILAVFIIIIIILVFFIPLVLILKTLFYANLSHC